MVKRDASAGRIVVQCRKKDVCTAGRWWAADAAVFGMNK